MSLPFNLVCVYELCYDNELQSAMQSASKLGLDYGKRGIQLTVQSACVYEDQDMYGMC